jgi:hypothetical protein
MIVVVLVNLIWRCSKLGIGDWKLEISKKKNNSLPFGFSQRVLEE